MTILQVHICRCDSCDYESDIHYDSEAAIERWMERNGWITKGKADFCPDCATDHDD